MAQGYYTLEEATRILGVSAAELKGLAKKGEIRSFQDRGVLRFRVQDVQELGRMRGVGSDEDLVLDDSGVRSPQVDDDFSLKPDNLSLPSRRKEGCCQLVGLDEAVTTDSVDRALLLGSHPGCNVYLPDVGAAAFHCLLTWLPKGLFLYDLGSGRSTLLDGVPVLFEPVADGQTITVGKKTIQVRVLGEPTEPANKRRFKNVVALGLTVVSGPHKGEAALLFPGRRFGLGTEDGVELQLPKETHIAARQINIDVRPDPDNKGKLVACITPLPGPHPTRLNQSEPLTEPTLARAGDLIHFSATNVVKGTALLLHQDLSGEVW